MASKSQFRHYLAEHPVYEMRHTKIPRISIFTTSKFVRLINSEIINNYFSSWPSFTIKKKISKTHS